MANDVVVMPAAVPGDMDESMQEDKKVVQLRFHVDGYKEIRKEIHYEYTLMANRINWLLASQTFLFTALAIAMPKDQPLQDISQSAFSRIAPIIGLCSTWLISSAIVANILRIWDWKRIQRRILKNVECLIPRFPRDSLPGFGLLPPVGLPLLFFSLWGYVLFSRIDWFWESRLILAVAFSLTAILSVWSSAFFFYCLDEDISAHIFKRPIDTIKRYRAIFFSVTIVLFFAMILYAVLKT